MTVNLLAPLWRPTHLRLGRETQWLLHIIGGEPGTDDSHHGACGVSLDAAPPRLLPDWPSSYDACLRCTLTVLQAAASVEEAVRAIHVADELGFCAVCFGPYDRYDDQHARYLAGQCPTLMIFAAGGAT